MMRFSSRLGVLVLAWGLASGCSDDATPAADDTGGSTGGASTTTSGELDGSTTMAPDTTSGTDSTGGSTSDTDEPDGDGPRYDDASQKSVHNAFQRHEAILDQLVYHGVRSIELDIHTGKTFAPDISQDWYVYHDDITDDDTWCRHLSDCLFELKTFHAAIPEHEVVTIWIDLKDAFDDDHAPDDLDALLQDGLGDAVMGPDELTAGCPGASDVRTAVIDPRCGWPHLDALRGRFVVALTGGDLADNGRLATYTADATQPLAFVAPQISGDAAIDTAPNDTAVIYNLDVDGMGVAQATRARGFISRVYGLNDAERWDAALLLGTHHLATDKVTVHQDRWATTHSADGWPFSCIDECDTRDPAPAPAFGVEVDSGDLWDAADDGWFAYEVHDAAPGGSWRALVTTPNSHVENFAKGCLMARTGPHAAAAYLAVCRPADDERLRVQVRPSTDASTTATEHDIVAPDTVPPEAAAYVRLDIDDDGHCATGFGSRDGITWIPIDTACFDAPLILQGVAASSHQSGAVRFVFVDVSRDDDAPRTTADFESEATWGTATATPFDGLTP